MGLAGNSTPGWILQYSARETGGSRASTPPFDGRAEKSVSCDFMHPASRAVSEGLLSVSVVVPVYNAEATLGELVRRLELVLEGVASEYEVLLVNDASRDRSWPAIRELSARNPRIRGIDLMRNYGQHNALLCGIRKARYSVLVTLDDDLQNPPEEIPKLLLRLSGDADVVYGCPEREQHNLWRNLASRITKIALQSVMGAATARRVSAFRVFRTSLREAFAFYRGPFVSIDTLLAWGTSRFDSVSVKHDVRKDGISNYTFMKLVTHAFNMMTGFTVLPLQIASYVGFTFTLFGIGVLVFVLARYFLQGTTVAGFPFLASVIAIFSGAQLFALGVIGEYLSRMHFRLMDRPPYAIREATTEDLASEQHDPKAL
jgi:undecaprenyl-phosphate 4-deoxy-4-formamido-L-arabinose transferase